MQRVGRMREELNRFLDDDSDMRQLYLTRKALEQVESPRTASGLAAAAAAEENLRTQFSLESHGSFETPALGTAATTLGSSPTPAAMLHGAIGIDDDSDVLEAENLLEAYYMQIDTVFNLLSVLDEHVDDTEGNECSDEPSPPPFLSFFVSRHSCGPLTRLSRFVHSAHTDLGSQRRLY